MLISQEENKKKPIRDSRFLHREHYPIIIDGSNINVKGCMMILKKITRAIRITTHKINKIKYNKINNSYNKRAITRTVHPLAPQLSVYFNLRQLSCHRPTHHPT